MALVVMSTGFGVAGAQPADAATTWPTSLTVDGATNIVSGTIRNGLYYAANETNTITTTTPSGTTKPLVTFSDGAQFNAVAVDSAGDVVFTLNHDPNIYEIPAKQLPLTASSSTAAPVEVLTTAPNSASTGGEFVYGLAFDDNDNLYYGTSVTPSIYKYAGGKTTKVVPNVPAAVLGMGFAPDGSLFFADNDGDVFSATPAQLQSGTPLGMSDLTQHTEQEDAYLAIAFTGNGEQFYYTLGTGNSAAVQQFSGGYVAGSVSVSGSPETGQTLTADLQGWASNSTYTYQWNRDGSPIQGADQSQYVPGSPDLNSKLSVTVTGTSSSGQSATATSEEVGPVLAPYAAGNVSISGTPQTGQTLTAVTKDWPAGTSFTYQWLRDGSAINGATSSTYSPVADDVSHDVAVTVVGSANGQSGTASSAAVQVTAPYVAGAVSITGTPETGQTLTAVTVNWPAGSTYTYQWNRAGTVITGATGSTYVPVAADASQKLTVTVTGTNNGQSGTSTSNPVGPVTVPKTYTAGTVSVDGLPEAGQVLTADLQGWAAGSSYTYQWLRDGAPISGATNSTYIATTQDVSHYLSVNVTGSLNGSQANASSTSVGPAAQYTAGQVSIAGNWVVGQPLTAVLQNWRAGSTYTYQWYRGTLGSSTAIPGATSSTYTPVAADAGGNITITVTGHLNGATGDAAAYAGPVTAAQPLTAPLFDGATSSTVDRETSVGTAFSYTDLGATGNPTPTYSVADEDGDGSTLPSGVTFKDGVLSGKTTIAGVWKVAVTAKNSQGTAVEHITLTVDPGSAVGMHALVFPDDGSDTSSPTMVWDVAADGSITQTSSAGVTHNATITAVKGSSITVLSSPVDQYGNYVVTGNETQITSSVAADTVEGNPSGLAVITFNHASPHVIAMQQGNLVNTFTVQVSDPNAVTPTASASATPTASATPVPTVDAASGLGDRLAFTGADLTAPLWLCIGLLTAAMAIIVARARARSKRQ